MLQKDENVLKEKYLWDENVSVYNVMDENNKHISTLMLDPFLRNRKINNIWSYVGRGFDLEELSFLFIFHEVHFQ